MAAHADWMPRRAGPVILCGYVAPLANRARYSLGIAPCNRGLQTPAETCVYYSEYP